jgi:uncharacterized repeat protein (TIGR01451 family)
MNMTLRINHKVTFIIVLLVAGFLASVLAFAPSFASHNISNGACQPSVTSGPQFNIFPLTYSGETCHDFPLIDARNVTKGGNFSTSQSDHDNGVAADPGDVVEFLIFYHNGAVNGSSTVANSVNVQAFLPGGTFSTHTVSAQISGSNFSTVTSDSTRGGPIAIQLPSSQTLTYVTGSTQHFPNRSTSSVSLPDGITSGGVNIGSIQACFEFSGFIRFRAQVGSTITQDTRILNVQKRVRNLTKNQTAFVDFVTADPSDRVEFEVVASASSSNTITLSNVRLRDFLPSQLTFESGTDFTVNEVNVGSLSAGQSVTRTFVARAASSGFSTGVTNLTNITRASADLVSSVEDSAIVQVTVGGGNFGFLQSKSAFNETKGVNATSVTADRGDLITYTLTFQNTGSQTLPSVTVEDDIGDILQLADLVDTGGAQLVGNVLRYPAVPVGPATTINKRFQVRVKNPIPSGTDLVMTNIYGNRIDIPVRPPSGPPPESPRAGMPLAVTLLFSLIPPGGMIAWRRFRQNADSRRFNAD